MTGINALLPSGQDIMKTKSWIFAGIGLVAGASLAYWAISKLQAAGITAVGQSYMSNSFNTLPNSPYRTFRSSTRFSS